MIGKVIGHIEEYNGNKCLILKNTKKYKKVLKSIKKYTELWDETKKKIENKNDGECNSVEWKYGKGITKIKFDTDDDLPLNKPLNLHMLAITVRSVFEDEGKFYPQLF